MAVVNASSLTKNAFLKYNLTVVKHFYFSFVNDGKLLVSILNYEIIVRCKCVIITVFVQLFISHMYVCVSANNYTDSSHRETYY